MKQVLIKKGVAFVEEVPAPLVDRDGVLVEVAYSLISAGTEMAGVQQSGKPLLKRALEQPEQVRKLAGHLKQQGLQKTITRVQGKLGSGSPSGYSCAGIVVQVGENVVDLEPGQRVACAGAGQAVHAELVVAPRNLVVPVPDNCPLRDAASVTLGSIALQGVRRADPRLGEFVAVTGLGLLGQITAQLLKAAGCRVVGIDLEPRRVALARNLGLDYGFVVSEENIETQVKHLTGGYGVDCTIITAAAKSDAIVQQSMEITRKKGRVVVVGDVGLGLKRSPFYQKEIDFLISCSYGPGRYDSTYEERGLDYPYAYVRWTENRNMAEFLRLIAGGRITVQSILEKEFPVDEVTNAYQALNVSKNKPLGVLLAYGRQDFAKKRNTRIEVNPFKATGKINVALVGAGGFAKSTHLPNLKQLSNLFHLQAVVSGTGSNAKAVARQFEANYATTRFADVLDDAAVDAVIICTQHHLHVEQAAAAALAGKAVFLEKPMALNPKEMDYLAGIIRQTQVPFMVGFNRRFSPPVQRAKEILGQRAGPLMISCRVNAGHIPHDHWIQTEAGGGRIVGEACHMVDVCRFLVGAAAVEEITGTAIKPTAGHISPSDNIVITVRYSDGSVATVLYTALGHKALNKEYVECFGGGKALIIDDYRSLQVFGAPAKGWRSRLQNKGHVEELHAFAGYVQGKSGPPILLEEIVDTTNVTFVAAGIEI